jgi:hypothetical protein
MTHKEIVVLQRCSDVQSQMTGRIVKRCSQCNEPVWVGPNVYMHPQARYAEIWCTYCYAEKINPQGMWNGMNIKDIKEV